MANAAGPAGYLALLRTNPHFRRLWLGQVVSELGDWFDLVALSALVYTLTDGSGAAIAGLFVAQFLPPALASLFAGVVIDRVPRKLVLVASDVGRALLVVALLLVRDPDQLWIIYLVVVLKVSLTGFFEPARSALIPSLVSRSELIPANALSSITWSAVQALGAALGGIVAGLFGFQVAILLDCLSFMVSAWLIEGIVVDETHHTKPGGLRTQAVGQMLAAALDDLRGGIGFILQRRAIVFYTLAKALWNIGGGGIIVLFTFYGREIFPLGQDGALSIGLFFTARGIGAGLGPVLANWIGGETTGFMRRMLGPSYVLALAGCLWLGSTDSFLLALLAIVLTHMGGSINWVFSTALLQIEVPDQLRGRVFAVEFATLMCIIGLATYLTGAANDAGWSPRALAVGLALLFIPPGVALTALLWRKPA